MSFLFPLFAFSQLCASDNIFPWFWKRETTELEHIDRNVIWSVRRQKYLHRLLRSVGKRQPPLYTLRGRCHPRRSMQDGLLPYSSAGNAVLPHRVPYGSDITGGIRHARKKCTWHREEVKTKFKKKKKKNTTAVTPPKRATKSTVCAHSLLDHKLHPTSFTFHREPAEKFILFRC